MDERLKQIWSGFQGTTTRNLTGRGVDNIAVPHRQDFTADDAGFLPEDYEAPAHAAFSALREELKRKEKKFGRRKKTADEASLDAEALPPQPMTGEDFGADQLLRGLKATAMRTERPERDYQAFLASDEGKAAFRKYKKKKRFGLF